MSMYKALCLAFWNGDTVPWEIIFKDFCELASGTVFVTILILATTHHSPKDVEPCLGDYEQLKN